MYIYNGLHRSYPQHLWVWGWFRVLGPVVFYTLQYLAAVTWWGRSPVGPVHLHGTVRSSHTWPEHPPPSTESTGQRFQLQITYLAEITVCTGAVELPHHRTRLKDLTLRSETVRFQCGINVCGIFGGFWEMRQKCQGQNKTLSKQLQLNKVFYHC